MDYCSFCEAPIGQRSGKQGRCHDCRKAGNGGPYSAPAVVVTETATCADCDDVFVYQRTRGRRLTCDRCRECRQKANQARYNASRSAEAKRNDRLRRWYSITSAQYDAMLAAQGGMCALCRVAACPTGKAFAVDHDHLCCPGKKSCGLCVRGLLCHSCNTGLGSFGDDPGSLRAAADYLESRRLRAVVS